MRLDTVLERGIILGITIIHKQKASIQAIANGGILLAVKER